jgi:hypothetical protein
MERHPSTEPQIPRTNSPLKPETVPDVHGIFTGAGTEAQPWIDQPNSSYLEHLMVERGL